METQFLEAHKKIHNAIFELHKNRKKYLIEIHEIATLSKIDIKTVRNHLKCCIDHEYGLFPDCKKNLFISKDTILQLIKSPD